ncbi:MAG: T9SS type A sorting domain-containing protein [Chitinophagaceae bacterium]|nr:T9SS type A sorting domain-containing protein [Chitinophagaceae bacterium]
MRSSPVLLLLALLIGPAAFSQLLTPTPDFPADTGTVTITVDCSKGNQGLFNYAGTGDVYVHTGVITDQSTSPANWRYVKFNQNFNQPNAALAATYLGNNKYSFTIPGIRAWYAVPAGEKILRVAILFRNGNGSQVERNTDGSDMYVQLYDGSLAIRFVAPPMQPQYTPVPEPLNKTVGDTLPVSYLSNKNATLRLYYNGAQVTTAAGANSLTYTLHITTPGSQQVIATADDGTASVADTINFFVPGAVNVAPIPTGMKEGINYPSGDTTAVLVLYAPHKNKVLVVGDFNNWTQQTGYMMNRTPDSNFYWLTIHGLTPGTEYAYQYIVDDTIKVADYNAEKILDKNVDPGIPASTYPGLKTFPAKAAGSLASILQTARPAYTWQVTNFQRPDKKGLVIYELLVRDFISPSNWQSLKDTLSYLKRLGINAIEVMPFTNFEGGSSWGYNPNFYFAPDKVYGTETALKQFIDACHQQGMAVIMDMVLNHSFGSSPMVQLYFDNTKGVPAAGSPWFNQYPTHAFNVGYQFNHESAATRTFTQRVLAYWLNNYHIDGYRFDLAKGFTQKRTCDAMGNNCDVGAWGAYDASRVAIWDTIYHQLQAISPGSYCILEMFADNSEEKVEANYGMLLWGNMNDNFNQATMGYGTASPSGGTWDLSGGVYTNLGWDQPGRVVYQESHDEERLMYKNEQYGNSSGSYNTKSIPTGLQRNALAAAFWAMLPGPKMLWEFGELGYDYSINTCGNGTVDANCRTDAKPSGWQYLSDTNRTKLRSVYAAMLKLRATYPQLAVPATFNANLTGAVKTLTAVTDSLSVAVIGNFDVVSSGGSLTFPSAGTWYNYFTGEPFTATGSAQSFTLNPGEYRVYVNKNLTGTVPTATNDVNYSRNPFGIRVYPNPAGRGNAVLEYELPAYGKTSLSILNLVGQCLATVDLGTQPSGKYSFSLSQMPLGISSLADGYYVLRIVSKQQSSQAPFLLRR